MKPLRTNPISMPRMLENLRDRLDEIERDNEWNYRFVCDLCERCESGPYRLSDKQFKVLHRIHQKYEG